MTGFVDIHTHILPNIDDGSTGVDETFEMFELAYAEGIRTIYATPHYGRCNPAFDLKETKKVYKLVAETLKKMHPDMELILGNEILYDSDAPNDLKHGEVATLGDTEYVLVEFAFNIDFASMVAGIRELVAAGYKPIIAHVERFSCLQGYFDRIEQLHHEGALLQVNSDMLLEPRYFVRNNSKPTLFRRNPKLSTLQIYKNSAWEFVHAGQIDFIASDAHGSEYRFPVMQTAFKMIYHYASPDIALGIITNARLLIPDIQLMPD